MYDHTHAVNSRVPDRLKSLGSYEFLCLRPWIGPEELCFRLVRPAAHACIIERKRPRCLTQPTILPVTLPNVRRF